ncbi:type II toxin-antitoxin system Phd/YefM family antitoxin [Streptomyces hypolithicus]
MMTESTYSIVEARARLGAIAREVSATREPAAITDHGQTIAILVSPADALEAAGPGSRSCGPCSAR